MSTRVRCSRSGSETSSNVVDALDSVDELETDLDQSKESMYKLSYVIRVSAPDLDELKRRCDEVKDFYDDLTFGCSTMWISPAT